MKKKRYILSILIISCLFIFIACDKNEPIKEIGDSERFSEKEIAEAIKLVEDEFSFPATTLTKVWYDEEKSDKFASQYLEGGRGSVNDAVFENLIVILSNFDVDDSGDNPVLNRDSTYEDYMWILIRDDKTSPWEIDDWGY